MARWFWGVLILAIIALLLALIGPFNANSRSDAMGVSIEKALNANNLNSVKVDMNGNVANLSGALGSQALMDKAVDVAANTECETCKKKGKIWHTVKSNLKLEEASKPTVQTVSPYTFSATKSLDGVLTVDGYVANDDDRTVVLQEADRVFPGNVVNRTLKIANGAPNSAWTAIINKYVQELAPLDEGRLLLDDSQALITGTTTDTLVRDRINALATNANLGYNEAANITVPNTSSSNVGTVTSESVCQTLLNSLKGDTKINFATGQAEIQGAQTFELLDRLASATNQCSTFRVQIDGHTDSDGNDDYNQWLSQARADTVAAYLAANGVGAERMTAVGYGETRPTATNETDDGKAANRRIEFLVTTSE